ncbi:hypothetical protein HRG_007194 [Hirsutella rhossiliensis]|uniref:Uncharacterized protein n=1 Tax=Hirsutella rhossiliensis TaxID=111463 RepID=A0A9P8MUJ2_9HYPO|nr:uncharacterized protein HRG_07390 [Hirsutella rhossiliensis]XP_044719627.1 uncharacterized protein HRG_07194 [Hirsutella rhossiliensis]KAH0961312.1 hypothetical protein HRG_07390 [Hirsutella rhossiliensis]KAH0962114.1 hypothetical protein HRG_07194 [Hirsutella rhossiliensis]
MPSYEYKSSGTNSKGNHYCSRDYGSGASNGNSYHYSNSHVSPCLDPSQPIPSHLLTRRRQHSNGSYYYSNPNGSSYYNDGQGGSTYKSSGGGSGNGGSKGSKSGK